MLTTPASSCCCLIFIIIALASPARAVCLCHTSVICLQGSTCADRNWILQRVKLSKIFGCCINRNTVILKITVLQITITDMFFHLILVYFFCVSLIFSSMHILPLWKQHLSRFFLRKHKVIFSNVDRVITNSAFVYSGAWLGPMG